LPSYIDSAVDLGCHEGYPGHHTYNALLEQNLVRNKGWTEFSLYPLFSPQSLLAEGSANYGIELAFPGDERIEFEREHLFPLAGLDASDAARGFKSSGIIAKSQVIPALGARTLNELSLARGNFRRAFRVTILAPHPRH